MIADAPTRLLFRAFDYRFAVTAEDAPTRPAVTDLLAELPAAQQSEPDAEYRIGSGPEWSLRRGSSLLGTGPAWWLLQLFGQDIEDRAVAGLGETRQALHAAGWVDAAGEGVLLAGPSGCGKSTLAAAALQAGLAVLADEVVTVEVAGLAMSGLPMAIALSPASLAAIGRRDLADGVGEGKRLIPRRALTGGAAVPAGAAAPRLARIVFPRHRPGGATRMHPVGPAEAARRLLVQAFGMTHAPATTLPAVCELAERVPAHALTFDDPARALELLAAGS